MSAEPSPGLPELRQACLEPDELRALERDLGSLTEILRVIPKRGAADPVGEHDGVGLAEGFERLRSGKLRGLQIHYRFEGGEWLDTLIASGEGIRIVRIRSGDR